jgi:hypothetical protein
LAGIRHQGNVPDGASANLDPRKKPKSGSKNIVGCKARSQLNWRLVANETSKLFCACVCPKLRQQSHRPRRGNRRLCLRPHTCLESIVRVVKAGAPPRWESPPARSLGTAQPDAAARAQRICAYLAPSLENERYLLRQNADESSNATLHPPE